MKKILIPFVLLISLVVPAFAAETEIVGESTDVVDSGTNVYVQNEIVLSETSDIPTGVVLMAMPPVTASDASGFKAVLLELLGDYDPVIIEYSYENTNGYTSYIREIEPDYVWMCTAAIFLVALYSVFRLGGALLCKR